jgi:UDP-galactopyranose mutase
MDELKQKYINAQSNLARGPQQVEIARKNYVIYNKGEPVYNQLVEMELTKKATIIATLYQDNFNEESQNILYDVKTYSGLLSNLKNVAELYLKYKQEANGLQNISFGGRLAEYKYYDMHKVIESALDFVNKIKIEL